MKGCSDCGDGDVIEPALHVLKIWLFVALPVTLFLEWRSLYRLRHSLTIWLIGSVCALVGLRLITVLWDWAGGNVPSLYVELLVQNRPYFLGNGVVDAILLTSSGLMIWAIVFWQPAQSRVAIIRRVYGDGSALRAFAMRGAAGLIGAGVLCAVALQTWKIFVMCCL